MRVRITGRASDAKVESLHPSREGFNCPADWHVTIWAVGKSDGCEFKPNSWFKMTLADESGPGRSFPAAWLFPPGPNNARKRLDTPGKAGGFPK